MAGRWGITNVLDDDLRVVRIVEEIALLEVRLAAPPADGRVSIDFAPPRTYPRREETGTL